MKNFRPLFDSVWIGLLAIACFFYHPAIAQADYPDFYPKAELIGSNHKAKIDIYGSPNTQQPPIGQAAVGDQVKVLEQATDNSGDRWDRVQLMNKTQLEGWIAEESVSLQKAESEVAPANPYFQINQFYPDSELSQNSPNSQNSQGSQNSQNPQSSQNSQNSQGTQNPQNSQRSQDSQN